MLLKRIFAQRTEFIRGWRKLHNEDFHNFDSSSIIIRMIYSRRMRYEGNVACSRIKNSAYNILVGSQKEMNNQQDQIVNVENIQMDLGGI
jgi:hypothetical protein